jgi:hypothetical protein
MALGEQGVGRVELDHQAAQGVSQDVVDLPGDARPLVQHLRTDVFLLGPLGLGGSQFGLLSSQPVLAAPQPGEQAAEHRRGDAEQGETRGCHDQRAHPQGDEPACRHRGTFKHGKRAAGHDTDRQRQRHGGGAGADQGGQARPRHPGDPGRHPDPRAHPVGGQPGDPRQGGHDTAHQQDQVLAAEPGHRPAGRNAGEYQPGHAGANQPHPAAPACERTRAHQFLPPACPPIVPSAGRHADGPAVRVPGHALSASHGETSGRGHGHGAPRSSRSRP